MSNLQKFKENEVQPKVEEIEGLSVSEAAKCQLKRELFRAIIAGESDIISAEEYQELRKAHVAEKRLTREQEKKLQKAYQQAQEAGFTGSREEYEEKGFGSKEAEESVDSFEKLNLPKRVKERLIEDYKDATEEEKEAALKQAASINLIEESKEKWNTVEIAGKTFSFLRPEPNGIDVFAGIKRKISGRIYDFEHVRYIRGKGMEKYLGEEQQMFAGKADFEEFIEKNIPGTTREKRLQNFVDLMGMEFVGVRFFDGVFLDLIVEGSVWVSHGGISFEFGPIPTLPYVDETWHECASPVLCYQD